MPLPTLDKKTKQAIAREIGFGRQPFIWAHPRLSLAAGSLATMMVAIVLVAQSAKPGTTLYQVKRGSEQVRVLVQPSFKQQLQQEQQAENQATPPAGGSGIEESAGSGQGSNDTKNTEHGGSSGEDKTAETQKGDDKNRTSSGSNKSGNDGSSGSNSGSGHGSDDH